MKIEPGMAYNTKTLNKVFAVLSILFLMTVIWTILDDYIRPWKAIQVKAMQIKEQVLKKQIAEMQKEIKPEDLEKINQEIKASEIEISKYSNELQNLDKELVKVKTAIYSQKMHNGDFSSHMGESQFNYEHAEDAGNIEAAHKHKAKFDDYRAKFVEGKDQLKKLEADERDVHQKIAAIMAPKTEAEKKLKALIGKKELAEIALSKTEITPVWILRNAPFGDFLDPSIKINQIVVHNVADDRYFQKVPKVDRCTTCHVFIDQKGYEEQANPYKTHPKIDSLAVGLNSAHPIKEFGCTSCHGGEGHRVNSFSAAAHMPENEEQKHEWIKKYDWHEPHKVPQPMFKLSQTEASCLKCHQGVEYIPMADKLNKGRQLISEYGCYNCHKIEGWQHKAKSGPSLLKISGKVSKEFAKNWVWGPHLFNPKSRMPSFFNQLNNSAPEFMEKNIAEVNSIVEYLWKNSKDYEPFAHYGGGDVEKGKELVSTVGCLGCHQIQGLEQKFNDVNARFGPYLTGTGSKVTGDWLVSWLKKPNHYQPDTRMPSLRLNDKEANDIAAYLLSLKNDKFANLKFEPLNKGLRDELLVGYFSAFDTKAVAEAKVAKMTDDEKTLELGRRSINKYGCYSCHNIQGFEGDLPGIGPELTKEGSKPVEQFGFGHQKIAHSRTAWLEAHLETPSRWDVGVPKPFTDLNRMPNFYLKKEEIEPMVVALLGQVADYVPMTGKKNLDKFEQMAADGEKVVVKYNCQGCHKIDGQGGLILKAYEDPNEGPPQLNGEGHRIQADWLHGFLKNVHPIRPYLKVRMPSFNLSNQERNAIVAYFQGKSRQDTFEDTEEAITWEPGEKEAAAKLFNSLACTSCHTLGFNSQPPQAPNLHYVKKRLRPSWIEKWLTNPQAILDYTVMPNFFNNGEETNEKDILGGDPKRQIKALTKYIIEFSHDTNPQPFSKN